MTVAVTIVLPLTGDPDATLACLTSLAALPDDPAHEVVVVDDASTGLDALLARLEGDVTVVRRTERGGPRAAWVDGVAAARGRRLVLLEDPVVVPDTLLDGIGDGASATTITGRGLDRHPPGVDPEVTIVIPTLDAAGAGARSCVRAIQATTDAPYEIVVVDNGAPPQGFTAPVNAGVRAARGRYVVICNDDVEPLPGWWPPLRAAIDAGDPVVFPWTVDHPMRDDFAAWCFALSRDAVERFAAEPGELLRPELRVWYQDTDLLLRLRAAGTPPRLVRESRIRHGLSRTVGSRDPRLRRWVLEQTERDREWFESRHGVGVEGAPA
ncbi:MAG: glycosyltransferase family 2 protein [Solirubrobacteraceae bacterium]|nr:glycosyltransferase family 2 protein [Solirubrobacteraceae bacterium]